MTSSSSSQHIMIVTGEASGDLHGSRLVRDMKAMDPNLRFSGLGGRELAAVGVEILYDASRLAVVGVTEVLSHLSDIFAARNALLQRIKTDRPALLILIDYPDFNLLLASKVRKQGIPIFYYISPQVWAWRSGRVKKIGKLSDRIGVILPFEKEFYRQRGVAVDFVGHPLMDSVRTTMSREDFLRSKGLDPARPVIGLLPGSRRKEIVNLLPDFLAAGAILDESLPSKPIFLVPKASTITRELIEQSGLLRYQDRLDIHLVDDDRYNLMAACDAAVAASGTVTLELAILGVPLVAAYKVSPRTYWLGRLLIHIDFFSLVNLVGGRRIIPELLQHEATPDNIGRHLRALLIDQQVRRQIVQGLEEVKEKLGKPGASQRAAALAMELVTKER